MQTYLSHSTYTDYISMQYCMNCICAYTLVKFDGSKVKVPLDAVLPGERPEMEKVYVDVPQIEYVPRPRDIPSCCAFIYKCVRGYMWNVHIKYH